MNRRVHITKETLDCLGDEYNVEPGLGYTRNTYLKDHNVDTYLIVPDNTSRVVSLIVIDTHINSVDSSRSLVYIYLETHTISTVFIFLFALFYQYPRLGEKNYKF